MNRTVIYITFIVLASLGLVGAVVLLILRPESVGQFTGLLITVLGLATTAAGTFYALDKQGQKLETIAKQTNGINTAKENENQRLTNIIIAAGLDPNLDTSEIRSVSPSRAPGEHASASPIQ